MLKNSTFEALLNLGGKEKYFGGKIRTFLEREVYMLLASLLSSGNFIMTNKILIKVVGTDAAIILGELCSEYDYWEQRGELTDNEWFYSTRENIENNTGLSEYKQRIAINQLIKMKFIEVKRMGIPCKVYYKLNEANILECYTNTQEKLIEVAKNPVVKNLDNKGLKNSNTSSENFNEQVSQNLDVNNNNNNNKYTQKADEAEEKIKYATKVELTENEYQRLINEHGEEKTNQLIKQLDLYKKATGKRYESDYAAILYWVIERVKEIDKNVINKQENKKFKKQKNNFEQREYPSGYFNQFIKNGGKNEENI